MPTYLETHPPARRQFRPRTRKPTGLIVVHTAESVLDQIGQDTGAEDVAAFIARRTDPGSYHTLADSDSTVRLVPFDQAAYGDGTGSNEFAIHVSFACKAGGWAGMSAAKRVAFIDQGVKAAVEAARWLKSTHGITVPTARVTKAQSDAGKPGFISHGERDPERRSDPGAAFPWDDFLAQFADAVLTPEERQVRRLTEKIDAAQAEKAKLTKQIARWRKERDELRP